MTWELRKNQTFFSVKCFWIFKKANKHRLIKLKIILQCYLFSSHHFEPKSEPRDWPQNKRLCLFYSHFIVFSSGFPLSIVLMAASDSAFLRMHFINNLPASADDSKTPYAEKIHLLILCKSGTMHTVATGRGIQPCTALFTERFPPFYLLMFAVKRKAKLNILMHYSFLCPGRKTAGPSLLSLCQCHLCTAW